MSRLSEAALDDLRARNPVADVVARLGITLRRSGQTLVGACPSCGGDPRRAGRFEVKDLTRWVCAVCQDGGDVIRLVMRTQGASFRDAVEWLGGAGDIDPEVAARAAREIAERRARDDATAARKREEERQRLYGIWRRAVPIAQTPAYGYLEGRGIAVPGLMLRAVDAMPYFHGSAPREGRTGTYQAPREIYSGPAMVAVVLRPDGTFGGLHLTWLHPAFDGRKAEIFDPDTGEALPPKKMRGSHKAGRIELLRARGGETRLIMGEGIETTASALMAEAPDGAPGSTLYWAAGSLGNLGGPALQTVPHPTIKLGNGHAQRVPGPVPDLDEPAIPVPESVTDLILLGDGDSEPWTTHRAMERGALRYARTGRTVRIAMAPAGRDFNDLLREGW